MTEEVRLILTLEEQQFLRASAKALRATENNTKGFKGLRATVVSVNQAMAIAGKVFRGFSQISRVVGGTIVELANAASDFEEQSAKFGTVFRDVSDESIAMRDTLVESFNFSKLAATDLLASTGDLLAGFGFTGAAALDLSGRVNMLAADLASFQNLEGGAARASIILTKALLGEKDALVSLGVKVLDADVQARLLADGKSKLTGLALRQAKAEATYALILQQSGNAIGDIQRTSQSYANQVRSLENAISDLKVELGEAFLTIGSKILPIISGLAKQTKSWVSANKQLFQTISAEAFSGFITALEISAKLTLLLVDAALEVKFAFELIVAASAFLGNAVITTFSGIGVFVGTVVQGIEIAWQESMLGIEKGWTLLLLGITNAAKESDILKFLLPDDVVSDIEGTATALVEELERIEQAQKDIPNLSDKILDSKIVNVAIDLKAEMDEISGSANEAVRETQDMVDGLDTAWKLTGDLADQFRNAAEASKTVKLGNGGGEEDDGGFAAFHEARDLEVKLAQDALDQRTEALSAFYAKTEAGQIEAGIREQTNKLELINQIMNDELATEEEKQEALAVLKAIGQETELEAMLALQEAKDEQLALDMERFAVLNDAFGLQGTAAENAAKASKDAFVTSFKAMKGAADDFFVGALKGESNFAKVFTKLQDQLLKVFVQTTTQRLIIQAKSIASGEKLQIAANLKQIASDAAAAGAGAYKAVVGIPIIGPILAPVAAAVAYAGTIAFGSRATGDSNVAETGPFTLHKGERVVSQGQNEDLTEFLKAIDDGGGTGGDVIVNVENFFGDEEFIDELVLKISESAELRNTDFRGAA